MVLHNQENYLFSLRWVQRYTIEGHGITVTSKQRKIYPEVSGYFIPTLLACGEKELAYAYAKYLCSIQKPDGSWYDCNNHAPYVFDSAQILKGFIAIRSLMPELDEHIIRGCDWILSNMQENGRLITPDRGAWGNDDRFCSELVHLYALSPIKEAGLLFNRLDYLDAVQKILDYYKRNHKDRILHFSHLSHFQAYIIEGLYDLGELNLCRQAMENMSQYQNEDGAIPALSYVTWICSTGLLQLALIWYKLGELERGNKLFDCAVLLQNQTGGWFGSYTSVPPIADDNRKESLLASPSCKKIGEKIDQQPMYFPKEEISWAVKYFLDAYLRRKELLSIDV